MTDKPEVPERLYFTNSKRAIDYIKWAGLDKREKSDDLEFIYAESLKELRELWLEHKDLDMDDDRYLHGSVIGEQIWQAIENLSKRMGWNK